LASRFDPDLVVYGDSQLLLTAEVMLGRLDGHMSEQELDLVELTACQMTEAGTCAPKMPHAAFSTLYRVQDYAERGDWVHVSDAF
jgi:hypothetical protein